MRIFLDTNVLFDITAQREPFAQAANKLLIMGYFNDSELWVSAKSYTDLFYVLRKTHGSDAIQQAFLAGMAHFNVCGIDGKDIQRAATLSWPDFEDCLIGVCADKVKADYLITRNAAGFKLLSIPALSPEDFLELVKIDHGLVYEDIKIDC